MLGGGIIGGVCVGGNSAGLCTLRDNGWDKWSVREGGVLGGTLRDDVNSNVVNDGIGGRETDCFCCKGGERSRGGYMLVKTCTSCSSAACCASPTR